MSKKMRLYLVIVLALAVGSNANTVRPLLRTIESSINSYYCNQQLSCQRHELAWNGSWTPKPIKHVMCNAGKYGKKCQHAECLPITNGIKEIFLRDHNEKRSLIAQGKGDGIFRGKTASRMATLVWNDELEMMALQNVAQCNMKRDQCHQTKCYKFPGQNLYAVWAYPQFLSDKYAINLAIQSWFDEYQHIKNIECINSFGSLHCPSHEIEQFTQIIWDDAAAVGCAIVKDTHTYYIACNYSYGNMSGRPVYKFGRNGSNCMTGLNKKYPGLCNEREFKTNNCNYSPAVSQWIMTGKKCRRNAKGSVYIFE